MSFLKKLRRRRRLERDLEDELKFHLDMSGDRRRFGNATLIKEVCREMWTFTALESWWLDLRYALRTLANNPSVSIVAVVTLAIGIGANTTVFTVVNAAFSYDFGVDRGERLVMISPSSELRRIPFPELYLDLRDLRDPVKSLQSVGAFDVASANLSDGANLPERFTSARISANSMTIMGRSPAFGRGFAAEDGRPGAPPAVILSDRLWQERYGRSASILGKIVRVDDVPRTVVGVMPPGARFPADCDLWMPLDASDRPGFLFGRLADGVKIAAARAEMDAIARRLAKQEAFQGLVVDVQPLLEIYGVYASRPLYLAQLIAVGFVLLIACANVANLLLGRAAARSREISIRIAIGAGRARIIRQLLVESVALSLAGGFLGWLVALGTLRWVDRLTLAQGRPPWVNLSMNTHVFAYLAAISIGTGILFGLAPALRLARIDVNSAVKNGGMGAAGGLHGRRLSSALVIGEMALCVVLLAGAGLLIRSTLNVYSAPIGVNPANVLTVHVNLPEAKYPRAEDEIAFHRLLKTRLEALPGVESVAVTSALPSWGFGVESFSCELEGSLEEPVVDALIVGADYFRVMQAQPVHGRVFTDSEKDAVVVNGIFAAKYWPGEDPVGKHIRLHDRGDKTVTGVVPDIQQSISPDRQPLIYLPYASDPQRMAFIAARTRVPPATLASAFRREAQNLDENLPLYDVQTLESRISKTRLNVGALGVIFTVFAAIAVALGAVGLYAVSAHSVSQRTQEIGIRMAMGGSARNILRLVFEQSLWQIALGLALGLPAAIAVTRVLRGSLIGVSPFDPVTFAAVIAILAAAGVLGCAAPARRATRVDPVVALRDQ